MNERVTRTGANVTTNVKSLRTWIEGGIQAVIYGVASSFLSAVGVNGTASLDLTWMQIEPLNLAQLGVVMLAGAAVKLAQHMMANPIFPSSS